MKLYILFFLIIFGFLRANSQSLSIFDIDTTNFPIIKAKFFAFDKDGKQIRPNAGDFSIAENSQPRTILNVTCPDPKPLIPISSVLVFDVSGSMETYPLDMEKTLANSWINMLNLGFSDCAITSFSNGNYINQDFTTNKNKLINAINGLTIISGTDYNAALIDPAAGGILMAKTGKHKRIIIFLTDGQPNFEPRTQEIIEEAKINNISIYCLSINKPAHHTMIEFSKQTGGIYFEYIKSKEEAEDALRKIFAFTQNDELCEIEWQSGVSCQLTLTNVELKLKSLNLIANASYQSQNNSIASLEITPSLMVFKNITLGIKKDTTIKVTARNADFNITNITSSNPAFTINKTNFTLLKNQSIDLIVSYYPSDSSYNYSRFSFESNICPANYFVSAGYFGIKPKEKTLKLIIPNGGEQFVIGSDTLIKWEGIPETDTVRLEYSIDNGKLWKLITNNTSSLKYLWKNVPEPESKLCKIRVSQINNLEMGNTLSTLLFTLIGHSECVNNVSWSPDGSRVATAGFDNNVKIWDASNGTEILTLTGHTGDVYNVSWSPDGSRIATAGFDQLAIIWDANTGARQLTLVGHTDEVLNVNWSPDGTHVATASFDHTAIIWDAITGAKLFTLNGQSSGYVYNASWSPDGTQVVTSGWDNTAIIWNALNGNKIYTLNGHTSSVFFVSWSPDGTRIATASDDKTAKIWDASNGMILNTLIGHTSFVRDVKWQPDNRYLATASADGSAIIWNSITGNIVHRLSGHNSEVYNVSWSPDGTRLATASWDSTAIIWDISSGIILNKLVGHTNRVYNVSWSPDGTQVATSSWDNTSKIWHVDNPIIQEDESDSVFSIVAPHATANNIDMKECLVGMVKDSVITNIIENICSFPVRIDSIYFKGADASKFRLLSNILPVTIKPYDKISLEFGFGPGRVGLHSADMVILTQSDTLFKKIIGTGYLPQLTISSKMLDFGEVYIENERTFTDTVLVKNLSAQVIDIPTSYQVGPDKAQFKIISGDGSFKLNPLEERKLTVRFKPSNAGRTTGGIAFEYNGVGSPAIVTLFGEGKNKEPNLQSNMSEIPNLICANVSEGKLSITNKCTEIIYFSEMNFKGNNSLDFSVPNFKPFILEPDSTTQVKIQFNPQFTGIKTTSLEIKSTAEPDSIINIYLTAKKDSVNISFLENSIDFGDIYLNQSKDSSITLKNFGTIKTGSTINASNNIVLSKNEIVLPENETCKIPFKFSVQSNESTFNEKISIIDSICNIVKEIIISGTAIKAHAFATLQVGSYEAYPGDTIEIPITISDKSNLEIVGITSLNIELSFNSTLLLPIDYNPEFIDFNTSKIKLNDLLISNIEIAKIKFVVGLGNSESTTLNISKVETIGGGANIITHPGTFKLLGICPEGGNRLINPSGKINISSIKPNPSDNQINVELQLVEKTGYKLIIVNSNGQTVREISRENSNKGIIKEDIEVSDLASGVYNLILQTESERISKLFLILK